MFYLALHLEFYLLLFYLEFQNVCNINFLYVYIIGFLVGDLHIHICGSYDVVSLGLILVPDFS